MVYPFESSTLPFERMARTKDLCTPRGVRWDVPHCKWTNHNFKCEDCTQSQGFQLRANGG